MEEMEDSWGIDAFSQTYDNWSESDSFMNTQNDRVARIEELMEERSQRNVEVLLSQTVKTTKVAWIDRFNIPGNKTLNYITHAEIDDFDFKKNTFNEVLNKPNLVRPYFDIDSITSIEQYNELISWLDHLVPTFGPYCIGGYTDNEEVATEIGFKLQPDGGHYISAHIVFFTVAIDSELMIKLMKHNKRFGYVNYDLPEYLDPAPYKLRGRQLFRHVLSNKAISQTEIRPTAGNIIGDLPPSCNIIQVSGSENILDIDDIEKAIPKKNTGTKPTQPKDTTNAPIEEEEDVIEIPKKKKNRNETKITDKDITWKDSLIMFTKNQMLEFLDAFPPEFDELLTTLAPLRYSPYDYDFLYDVLREWYGKRDHHNGVDNVVQQVLGNYYKKTMDNKWFFSIIKHMTPKTKAVWLKLVQHPVDYTININTGKISIEDVYDREYNLKNFGYLINDLRQCYGFFEDRHFLKRYEDGQYTIEEISSNSIGPKLKNYKPIKGSNDINLYGVVKKFSNCFKYIGVKFMANPTPDEEGRYVNKFQGFKYEEILTDDFSIIQPLLEHTKNIICNGDELKYDYMMKWWANIIQNTTVKNCTMPIIYGNQGSGKSIFVECMCELLGSNALSNCDDLGKVFDKFNVLNTKYLVIVINEPPEANDKFKFQGKIKSKITQNKQVVERKGMDAYDSEMWANYIMTTNNPNPILEEKGNRRIIYYETSNEKVGDFQYFKELMAPIQPKIQGKYEPEFMGILLHYMKTQIDVEDWNGEALIRMINSNTTTAYNEQLDRQLADCNVIEKYLISNYRFFLKGFALGNIYIEGRSSNTIAKTLSGFCTCERLRINQIEELYDSDPIYNGISPNISGGLKQRIYKLKPRIQIPDLYSLIEYEHNGDEEEDVQMLNE